MSGSLVGMDPNAPFGIFKAVKTRDAVAGARDGWPFFEANARGTDAMGELIYEIRFGDGEWMIAAESDLTLDSP